MELESKKSLQRVRDLDISVDFETDTDLTVDKVAKKDLDTIQEDLDILETLIEYLFFRPSEYHNEADWNSEYISMSYLDKRWTPKDIYEKVKQWCFKHKIRGTNNGIE